MKWKGRRQSKHIEIRSRDDTAAAMAEFYGHLSPINNQRYEEMRQETGGKIPTPTPNPRRKNNRIPKKGP